MNENQAERLANAFESIASSLEGLYKLHLARFDKDFPPKKEVRDADITHLENEEEKLRKDLGDTGERTVEEWLEIGEREREFNSR